MAVPVSALLPSVQPVTLVRGVKVMALHASVSTEPLVTVTLAGVTSASSTAMLKTYVPGAVGVPASTPVLLLIARPAGSVPELTRQF